MKKNPPNACRFKKKPYLCIAFETKHFSKRSFGEMAEWSIAAVLKTVVLRGTGGSNPSLSAKRCKFQIYISFFISFLPSFRTHFRFFIVSLYANPNKIR